MNIDCGLLKYTLITGIDVAELLRIAVDKREPTGLNLNHQAMTWQETMGYIWHCISNACHIARFKGFGIGKTLTELASHHLATDKQLIACHHIAWQHLHDAIAQNLSIGEIIRIYINNLDDEVRICGTDIDSKIHTHFACQLQRIGQNLGLESEYIRTL